MILEKLLERRSVIAIRCEYMRGSIMKEIKPLLCRQCGSHDLRPEQGRYVCHYCGTVHYGAAGAGGKLFNAIVEMMTRSRTAVVVSAAAAFLALFVAGLFIINRSAGPAGRDTSVHADRPVKQVEAGKEAIEPDKKVSAEFTDIAPLNDVIGNIYFVGMFRNTGETPVYPRAEIALYDAKGEKVAVGRGYGIRGYIMPGERTPVSVLVMRAPAYKTVKSVGIPESPSYYRPRPRLGITRLKMTSPAHRYDYYRASGRVRNGSGRDAQHVQVAVTAFDDSGRIIGHAGGFIGQSVLRNGDDAPFSVEFHIMKGKPARFEVDYNASEYRPQK